MRNMFTLRDTFFLCSYNLRGNYILTLPVPRTTLTAFILFLTMLPNYGTYCQTLQELAILLPLRGF